MPAAPSFPFSGTINFRRVPLRLPLWPLRSAAPRQPHDVIHTFLSPLEQASGYFPIPLRRVDFVPARDLESDPGLRKQSRLSGIFAGYCLTGLAYRFQRQPAPLFLYDSKKSSLSTHPKPAFVVDLFTGPTLQPRSAD